MYDVYLAIVGSRSQHAGHLRTGIIVAQAAMTRAKPVHDFSVLADGREKSEWCRRPRHCPSSFFLLEFPSSPATAIDYDMPRPPSCSYVFMMIANDACNCTADMFISSVDCFFKQ